jgi:hypothetical protein
MSEAAKSTYSHLKTTTSGLTLIRTNSANRGLHGATVMKPRPSLKVMSWNIQDFGSGFQGWIPLPKIDESASTFLQEHKKWVEHQEKLSPSAVGRNRGFTGATDASDTFKRLTLRQRLVDLAEHIVSSDADVIVLLEIMTGPKGGGAQGVLACDDRLQCEALYCMCETSGCFGSAQLLRMANYLKSIDEKYRLSNVTFSYWVTTTPYGKVQQEYNERWIKGGKGKAKDLESIASRMLELGNPSVQDAKNRERSEKFWQGRMTLESTRGKKVGKVFQSRTDKSKYAASPDGLLAWLGDEADSDLIKETFAKEESTKEMLDERELTEQDLTDFLDMAFSSEDASASKNKKDESSSSSSERKYGLALLDSLNEILAERADGTWKFDEAELSVKGETVATCVRNGWVRESAQVVAETASANDRPLYRLDVQKFGIPVTVYAAHAPAPNHLPGSKTWYTGARSILFEENDSNKRIKILCGDFNLDKNNKKAQSIQETFYKDMSPALPAHETLRSSFKATGSEMNCAYDKVLLVHNGSFNVTPAMVVSDTWKNCEAGRRYSDHTWVVGNFVIQEYVEVVAKLRAEEEARIRAEEARAEEEARIRAEEARAEEEARIRAEEARAEEEARIRAEEARAEEEARIRVEQKAARRDVERQEADRREAEMREEAGRQREEAEREAGDENAMQQERRQEQDEGNEKNNHKKMKRDPSNE